MFLSGGMGISPLTWVELTAFTKLSAYPLQGFEAELIMNMSQAYCAMNQKANKLGCPAPYMEGLSSEQVMKAVREKVAKQWASFENKLEIKRR